MTQAMLHCKLSLGILSTDVSHIPFSLLHLPASYDCDQKTCVSFSDLQTDPWNIILHGHTRCSYFCSIESHIAIACPNPMTVLPSPFLFRPLFSPVSSLKTPFQPLIYFTCSLFILSPWMSASILIILSYTCSILIFTMYVCIHSYPILRDFFLFFIYFLFYFSFFVLNSNVDKLLPLQVIDVVSPIRAPP